MYIYLIFFAIQQKLTQHCCCAKSLQSCPTLCDPIDGSSPGVPVPGILQARTLEWVAISFSNADPTRGKICDMEIAQNPTKRNPSQLELCFIHCSSEISPPVYHLSQSRVRAEHKSPFRQQTLTFGPL